VEFVSKGSSLIGFETGVVEKCIYVAFSILQFLGTVRHDQGGVTMNKDSEGNNKAKESSKEKTYADRILIPYLKYQFIPRYLPAIVWGVIVFGLGLFLFIQNQQVPSIYVRLDNNVTSHAEMLYQQHQAIENIQKQLDLLSQVDTSTGVGEKVATLDYELKAVESRLETLEQAFVDNPSKALSVPLLRMDLINLRESYEQDIIQMDNSVDRIYNLSLYLFGAFALGLLYLLIQMRGRPKD